MFTFTSVTNYRQYVLSNPVIAFQDNVGQCLQFLHYSLHTSSSPELEYRLNTEWLSLLSGFLPSSKRWETSKCLGGTRLYGTEVPGAILRRCCLFVAGGFLYGYTCSTVLVQTLDYLGHFFALDRCKYPQSNLTRRPYHCWNYYEFRWTDRRRLFRGRVVGWTPTPLSYGRTQRTRHRLGNAVANQRSALSSKCSCIDGRSIHWRQH